MLASLPRAKLSVVLGALVLPNRRAGGLSFIMLRMSEKLKVTNPQGSAPRASTGGASCAGWPLPLPGGCR